MEGKEYLGENSSLEESAYVKAEKLKKLRV
jgi:hypothetical protein